MRLLLISNDFLPNMGGVSLMMHHIANALEDQGIHVMVAPPLRDGEIFFNQKYLLAEGKPANWYSGRWYEQFLYEGNIRQQLGNLIEKFQPDAILLGDQAYGGQFVEASLWAQQHYNLPLGVYCHGMDIRGKIITSPLNPVKLAERALSPVFGNKTLSQRVRKLIKKAEYIFANSQYTATLVENFANRSSIITGCGLADEDWQREVQLTPTYDPSLKRNLRDKLGFDERPTITFIGRIVPRKNVDILLEALALLPDYQLLIIGSGPIEKDLKQKSQDLNVMERVSWLGFLDEQKKWEILRASDVLCLPATEKRGSGVEGFGIVLLEAAAAGTPVVAAKSGGMTDVVKNEMTGLLWDPKDIYQLAEKINLILADSELAEYCVKNARNQIREKFNWANVAKIVAQNLMLK